MELTLVFVLGAIIGSFLNVCICRMQKNESVVFPPSHCPKCNKNIAWFDNIPVLSYIALRGKCRSCRCSISVRYPVVELLTAILFTALYTAFGPTPKFFAYSAMTAALIVSTFIDFDIQEIPDEISVGGTAAALILAFVFPSIMGESLRLHALWSSFLGALTGGGSIYLLGVFGTMAFKKDAMGGGDVKLMAMIGAVIGWKYALLTFFLAPFLGSVPGIIMKFRHGKEVIPYGPFLSMAALLSVFFGDRIIQIFFRGFF